MPSDAARVLKKIEVEPINWFLIGEIGEQIMAADVDRTLREIGPKPLRITLRCSGGDVTEAHTIYRRLREHAEHHLVSIVAVETQSAGVLLYLAADDRLITANGTLFFHNVGAKVSASMFLTPTRLREIAAAHEGISRIYGDILAERSGLPRNEVFELMEKECCLGAERAVQLGFASEIIAPIY